MVKPSLIKPNFALLPPQALVEFKRIFKEEIGFELPDDEAAQKATSVLNLFKVLAKRPVDTREVKERK